MPFARTTRTAPSWAVTCPRCHATSGSPCHSSKGNHLTGSHIERVGAVRGQIQASLSFYANLGIRTKDRKAGVL
jgi:hypothetical protein